MKKKFLSLMMAAAVVATTSVSAFAAGNDVTVTNDGKQVPVTIRGSVNGDHDKPAVGTLSVTVPTALSFTVKNDGTVEGTQIRVENNGTQDIKVYAYQFMDTTANANITIHNSNGSDELQKRSDVMLKMNGNAGTAVFKSENGSEANNGVYELNKTKASGDGVLISSIVQGENDDLKLTGEAGTTELVGNDNTNGVVDKFTLRLKIKKA